MTFADISTALGFASATFSDGFWPNFWSTIFAGSIVGGLVTWILAKAKRPKLDVSLEIFSGTQGRHMLMFSVINKGHVSFEDKQIQWHVFFDSAIEVQEPPEGWTKTRLNGKSFWYFTGTLELPCFVGAATYFFRLPVVAKGVAVLDLNYYYSLSTAHGFFPKLCFIARLFKKNQTAPGGNQFVRMPLGEIVMKAI